MDDCSFRAGTITVTVGSPPTVVMRSRSVVVITCPRAFWTSYWPRPVKVLGREADILAASAEPATCDGGYRRIVRRDACQVFASSSHLERHRVQRLGASARPPPCRLRLIDRVVRVVVG